MKTPLAHSAAGRSFRLAVLAALFWGALAGRGLAAAEDLTSFSESIRPDDPLVAQQLAAPSPAPDGTLIMDFMVALKMRNYPELLGRIAKGETIPLVDMAATYNPLEADAQAVAAWLQLQGFTVNPVDATHLGVSASGTVAQIQAAFGVQMGTVVADGISYPCAITAPSLPAAIAPPVLGINGLQPHIRLRARANSLQPHSPTASAAPPYIPSEILKAYKGYGMSVNGAGQKIGIVIDTFPNNSDLTKFWSASGIAQTLANIEHVQVVSGSLPAPSGEETLDVEWASGIAAGAKVRIYATKDLSFVHCDMAYQQIINDLPNQPTLHQMSMSYGLGETYTALDQLQTDAQYFATLASQGVTIFVASGDGGSSPGVTGHDHGGPTQVETPSSDPNVIAVGGTTLTLNGDNSVHAETAWYDGGGGLSQVFARPPWQVGTGIPAGTKRAVPDVALAADPATGGYVILNGSVWQYGGISWSAPAWAGLCALINQSRAKVGNSALGSLGPKIYPLLGTANLRDLTRGTNGGYSAGAGYDLCTGLGAPNVATLTQTLTGQAPAGPNLTFYKPAGWSDKIVVSNVTGTSTDTLPLAAGDPLYVDFAPWNNGDLAVEDSWDAKIYVDGAEVYDQPFGPGLDAYYYYNNIIDKPIGALSPGIHTIQVILDTGGTVAESDETDNVYQKTVEVFSITHLASGVPVTGLSGATGAQQLFDLTVTPIATNLTFSIHGGTGDADLYVRYGAPPTTTTYDYRSWLTGNDESVAVASPKAGTWYVMLNSYDSYSGVTLLAVVGVPEITVEQPAGTGLTDAVSSVDFGQANLGGTAVVKTFVIRNTGTANLTSLAVTRNGANYADFTVGTLTPATLAPGASTTLNVTFKPATTGVRNAAIHISSNDANENPFDITLTGSGSTAGRLAFGGSLFLVNEEAGTLAVPLTRSGGSDGAVTVKVSTINGTAKAPGDFTGLSGVTVSFAAGQTAASVPVTIQMDALGEPSETFTLALSGATNGAALTSPTTATIRIIDFNDVVRPTVSITTPLAGASMAEGNASVAGTAADNNLVARVQVAINGGAFADAITTTIAASGLTATYSARLSPAPGANTVSVRSQDSRGNLSLVQSRAFYYVVLRPLTVYASPAGYGSLTAPFPGTDNSRKVGYSYTLTATPMAGYVFNGWTANSTAGTGITPAKAELPTLTFIHQQGLVLTANFIPNPFTPAVTGVFNGLILPSPSQPAPAGSLAGNNTVGLAAATVSTTGALTGKLLIDGLSLPFAGVFDNSGAARFGAARSTTFTLIRSNGRHYDMPLHLDLDPAATNQITGSLTQSLNGTTTAVSTFYADRAYYNGTTIKVPANLAGTLSKACTAIFPARTFQNPPFTTADYPQGDGYAAGSVSIKGIVSLSGKLADGAAITAAAPLSKAGTWPLFNALYAVGGVTQGCLAGQITVNDTLAETDMAGANLLWFRPAQVVQWYPNGWPGGILVDLAGAKYTATLASLLRPVDPVNGNAGLTFSHALLTRIVTLGANVNPANVATRTTSNTDGNFTLNLTATGLMNGTFTHTAGVRTAFQGVIFEKGSASGGHGFFLSPTPTPLDHNGQSGAVNILPK